MHDPRALRAVVARGTVALAIGLCGCSTSPSTHEDGPDFGEETDDPTDGTDPTTPLPARFEVKLVANGVSGTQRVNFALPLPAKAIADGAAIRVLAGSTELAVGHRALASYPDGSPRSVQLQVDVDVTAHSFLTVELGVASAASLELAPVAGTLTGSGNDVSPKVWALLPSEVLAASTLVGPIVPRASVTGTALDAWSQLCDYDRWGTDAFIAGAASRDVWLFDRVTAMYRGYAITGELSPLRSAYREASIYRAGMTVSNGATTAIAVPGASTDLKYHYSQGVALHYLLTGDDRFREVAEAISARVAGMWDPDYNGTDEFWTERHAGFALLAHEWAARVTDDRAVEITGRADTAVSAFLAAQLAPRFGQGATDARCFAHTATAHGESWGTNGCSPWMSAILADGLDAHARRVGGTRADDVRTALARLARIVAREGRDSTGRPLYWMGVGGSGDEVDAYDEHWGESAYIVALGWTASGRTEQPLKDAADQLVAGLRSRGEVGQVRSFNWQCRSAVMAPALLQ
ncbi:MAG: hypothetical protein M3680_07650 [Myxococcota bacterium]|nr:hypothetical protein [Myxococcota bacterium]